MKKLIQFLHYHTVLKNKLFDRSISIFLQHNINIFKCYQIYNLLKYGIISNFIFIIFELKNNILNKNMNNLNNNTEDY